MYINNTIHMVLNNVGKEIINLDEEMCCNEIYKEQDANGSLGGLPIEIWCIIIEFCGFLEKAALKSCCRAFDLEIHRNNIIDTFVKEYNMDCLRVRDSKFSNYCTSEFMIERSLFKIGYCYINCGNEIIEIAVHDLTYLFQHYPFVMRYINRLKLNYGHYIWQFDGGYIELSSGSPWKNHDKKLLKIAFKKEGSFYDITEYILKYDFENSYLKKSDYFINKFRDKYNKNMLNSVQKRQIYWLLKNSVMDTLEYIEKFKAMNNYIHLDFAERPPRFSQVSHEYLIEQLEFFN